MKRLACWLAAVALSGGGTADAAVTGEYDVALLRVRFADSTDALYSIPELTTAAGEIHQYYDQLSYGQLDLRVRPVDVTVPGSWNDYLHCTTATCPSLISDAADNAAAGGFDFTGVEGILVVRAGCRENNGWTNGPAVIARTHITGTFQQSYDVECGRTTLPSTVNWGGWAHELGHQLEGHEGRWSLTHPTGYESGYNLMDSCYPCGESAFSLAPESLTNETGAIASSLVFPGWLPADRIRVIGGATGTGTTVVLSPITDVLADTTAALGVKIPIARGQYYFLEARRHIRADAWPTIYDEGVQIIKINEAATDRLGDTIDSCDTLVSGGCIRSDSDPRGAGCGGPHTPASQPACWPFPLWHDRNVFRDAANNIAIAVGPATGNGFPVTVTRGVAPGAPDLYVTPWLTPPLSTWETIDIWIDSSCNGYEDAGGTLRWGRRADHTVVGNGDDPCANHENRIYARIRNIGDAPASDAHIRFDVSNPLGVGISGAWTALGTATSAAFPALASIPAGGETTVYATWTPTISLSDVDVRDSHFAFHSCVRVSAPAVAGEHVTTNLDGDGEQENIDSFEVSAGRATGAQGHARSFRLHNPSKPNDPDNPNQRDDRPARFYFLVQADLPKGWHYEIAGGAESVLLKPGEARDIPVKVTTAGDLDAGKGWHIKVAAYTLEPLRPPPYIHTDRVELHPRIAGGVDFGAQAVDPSTLAVHVRGGATLIVDGQLQPAVDGAHVSIDYTDATGKTVTHVVVTDDHGAFHDATVKTDNKDWRVRAFWQGSNTLASAATEAMAPQSTAHGFPLWCYLLGALIVVVALGLLVLTATSRKRKP